MSHYMEKINAWTCYNAYAREQAKPIDAQSHQYENTRLNMHVTIHNTADQTFWILYFLCVFGFLTQKEENIDKKKSKNIQSKNKQTQFSTHVEKITKSTQPIKVTKYRKY